MSSTVIGTKNTTKFCPQELVITQWGWQIYTKTNYLTAVVIYTMKEKYSEQEGYSTGVLYYSVNCKKQDHL